MVDIVNDINAVNLLNQIRAMTAEAKGVSNSEDTGLFDTAFANALNQASNANSNADALTAAYEKGDPNVSLADAMVATQKANLGFQAVLMVRNKVVQAYQDIMNMPV